MERTEESGKTLKMGDVGKSGMAEEWAAQTRCLYGGKNTVSVYRITTSVLVRGYDGQQLHLPIVTWIPLDCVILPVHIQTNTSMTLHSHSQLVFVILYA